MSVIRTRWAAIGAAVAVSLGAGGIGLVSAELGTGDKPVTVLLDAPCRLLETRPNLQGTVAVPSRNIPLGPGENYTVSATAAPLGNCDLTAATLGTSIVGLVTNVTPVLPTAPTDLRLYPTGAPVPETSNLNPAPGQPPTPNSVTVGLNGSGQFDILNKFGQVHMIVDVIGYLVDHNHDDRYYTDTEVDGLVANLNARIDALEAERPFVWTNRDDSEGLGSTPESVVSVTVTAPATGNITVMSTTTVRNSTANEFVGCSISDTASFNVNFVQRWESPGSSGEDSQLSGVRVFDIGAGQTATYHLVCYNLSGGTAITFDTTLAAIFTPGA